MLDEAKLSDSGHVWGDVELGGVLVICKLLLRILHAVRVGIEVVLAGIEGWVHPKLSLHVLAWIYTRVVERVGTTVEGRLRWILTLHSLVHVECIDLRIDALLRWVGGPLQALGYWRPMVVEHNILQLNVVYN